MKMFNNIPLSICLLYFIHTLLAELVFIRDICDFRYQLF